MVSAIHLEAALLQAADWEAAGHAEPGDLLGLLGRVVSVALAVGFALLVVRALARGARYRAVSALSQIDRDALLADVAAVEKRTVGEVVPVVLERSDAYPVASWIAGTATLGIGTAVLWSFHPFEAPTASFGAQILCFLAGFALARALPDLRRLFVTERRADEMAREQATQEFYAAGLHRTQGSTGVLLFVSLFERRVIVLGDAGIDAQVDAALWTSACDAVLDGVRRGALDQGLGAGVRKVGDVLAEHFPWREGDRDEVQNRVIVRRE
jgi:putative membrane protein